MSREYIYKLDFYYQQALIYMVTLVIYIGIKGTFIDKDWQLTMQDPVIYMISFFVFVAFVVLILNRWRERKIILTDNKIIFWRRSNESEILIQNIEWIYIGRERGVKTAGLHQMVLLKVKNRKRAYRIRVGRYERQKNLLEQFQHLAKTIPIKKRKTILTYTKELTRRKSINV
ncbi:MAG: hypothetical protein O3A55_00695 [Bacteroidetes bacterium]|nr:hypothetical protein [Bacteroidota bacterium]